MTKQNRGQPHTLLGLVPKEYALGRILELVAWLEWK